MLTGGAVMPETLAPYTDICPQCLSVGEFQTERELRLWLYYHPHERNGDEQ